MNVLKLDGNPYLDLWCGSAQQSGARLRQLTWRRALGLDGGRADWIHIQWPEFAFSGRSRWRGLRNLIVLVLSLVGGRALGTRVLLTAHNLHGHDRAHPVLESAMLKCLGLLVTDLHVMTKSGADIFRAIHPQFRRANVHVIPHGNYSPLVRPDRRDHARDQLGLSKTDTVLLTFGALRAYKGVDTVVDLLGDSWPREMRLVVVGKADEVVAEKFRMRARENPCLVFRDGFLAQEVLTTYVSAADWVILPYRRILNSGSLLLALSVGRPVIVPDTATFREIRSRVGDDWVQCYAEPLTVEDLIGLTRRPPTGHPKLDWCDWDEIARLQTQMFNSCRKSAR